MLFYPVRHRVFSDRASGYFLPAVVPLLGRLPPYCQFIFKTLTAFTRPEHLSFDARPLPTQTCLISSAHSTIVQIGIVGRLVLGNVSQAWVLPGRLHPENLEPPPPGKEEISGCAPTCIRGYCWILPFPMSVPANMHSKDNQRETICSCVLRAPGTVPQDVVEIDSELEPLPGTTVGTIGAYPCLRCINDTPPHKSGVTVETRTPCHRAAWPVKTTDERHAPAISESGRRHPGLFEFL